MGERTWPALDVHGADDLIYAALVDHAVAAIEEREETVRVFFHTNTARQAAATALRTDFPALRITPLDIADEDWASRSQENLTAVRVGRIVVAPPWDVPDPHVAADLPPSLKLRRTTVASGEGGQVRPTVVVIKPSMGFGTGHHATTRLCLAALQQQDLAGRSVVDVGTGSGVLAMAASLLGADRVMGIDDDPDALQAARESLLLNPAARVDLRVADLRSTSPAAADVVLANLTGALLVAAAGQLEALANAGGRLILSGFMEHEEGAVRRAFTGSDVLGRTQEDEWCCLVLQRRTTA